MISITVNVPRQPEGSFSTAEWIWYRRRSAASMFNLFSFVVA